MKLIFISGPFRGKDHWVVAQNVRKSEELAWKVWELGHAAISPHANTAHFQDSLPDRIWLEGDLEILKRCDAVLLCGNWQSSSGTLAEIEFANSNNIPIFSDINDIFKRFLEG